jgi:tRNA(Ile2)-agmatinylcytidine synthase
VVEPPETRAGGHVFVTIAADGRRLPCVAFEPTKRFREHVRGLRVGDRITAAGEVRDGTLKLEKFAVRELVEQEAVTPTCQACGRRMESAGATQGYRCRDCETSTDSKDLAPLDRDLEVGWYEVPPCARRHIAKPLVRGGFDAPTHPER